MGNAPVDLSGRKSAARPNPMRVVDASALDLGNAPARDWLIPSILIRRSITLFAGDGGVGKSLACQQLQVAAALGVDWFGLPIAKPINSFGWYCEDDEDELHRRVAACCAHYGATAAELGGRVRYACRVGEHDNEVIAFRGRGDYARGERTANYSQIADEVSNWGAELIILDTVSDIFAGNENIRYQVKTALSMLRGLALINNGGILLTSHPSKTSMVDGSGFSGSTAWNGGARNRLYLTTRKQREEDGDVGPTDERDLKIMKSNYGPFGEKIKLRWQDGVFVRTDIAPRGSLVDRIGQRNKLLSAAVYLMKGGQYLSPEHKARTGLVNVARELPSCRDLSWAAAQAAQGELIEAGHLLIVRAKRDGKWRDYIRPSELRYPTEKGDPE